MFQRLRQRLDLWLYTTDSNKKLPGANTLCAVWLAAASFSRPMRLSHHHELPCWVDAQGNYHSTQDTRWRVL